MNRERINTDLEKVILTSRKICTICLREKPLNMFYNDKIRLGSTGSHCKPCVRFKSKKWRLDNPERAKSADLKKKYGITLEGKNSLFELQGRVCGACGTDQPGGKYNEWHLDHCHDSKIVRGVLCADCNIILGIANDDAEKLRKLSVYIAKFSN